MPNLSPLAQKYADKSNTEYRIRELGIPLMNSNTFQIYNTLKT